MTISRTLAEEIAAKVFAGLSPHVERIEICGELRMRMPTISSIEFIVAPWNNDRLLQRCAQNCRIAQVSPDLLSLDLPSGHTMNLHVAVWNPGDLVTPGHGNFGVQQLLRTGTRPFIRELLRFIRKGGYSLDHKRGLTYGTDLVASEEKDIFFALGLEFIDPEARTEFKPRPLFETVPL